ncbi:MAG: TIGR02996 domain-containing protein [Gemmataceae bacterium]
MESEYRALLSAIVANPHDATPRLIAADWFEERGDAARAQFIRLELEAEDFPPDSAEREERETAAARLVNQNGPRWLAHDIPDLTRWYDTRFHFCRGFVGSMHTVFRAFVFNSPELFRITPITSLQLETRTGVLPNMVGLRASIKRLPDLSTVEELRLGPRLHFRDVDPTLSNEFNHGRQVLDTLCSYPTLTRLQTLRLAGIDLTDAIMIYLAKQLRGAIFLPTLRVLDLSDNRMTDSGAWALASARGLDGLTELHLTGNRITERGLQALRNRFDDRLRMTMPA